MAPLMADIESLDLAAGSTSRTLGVAREAVGYYARRVVDRCMTAVAG